jgi:signal peptidase I
MMGDNRNNSQDARVWGYVPFNHVVGKPVFVWMSLDKNKSGLNKIRWDRMFTTVGGSGEPVSYFKYFLMVLGGWFLFSFFRKKKKKRKA